MRSNKESAKESPEGQPEKPHAEPAPEIQAKDEAAYSQELIDQLKRLQAEFENYKKRIAAEQERFCQNANEELVTELLSVLDNLELALQNEKEHTSFYKGVELIYSHLYETLEKVGLTRMKVAGERFDPRLHEALLAEQTDKEPGTVLEELQAGYSLNGKVIRHAKVKVAK